MHPSVPAFLISTFNPFRSLRPSCPSWLNSACLAFVLFVSFVVNLSHAQTAKSRADLYTEANTALADTGDEPITPADVRNLIRNVVASSYNPLTDGEPGGGDGTVTTFSTGNLAPLFTASVANATTTPALSFTLSNAAQNAILAGPGTGGTGAPSYRALIAADIPSLTLAKISDAGTMAAQAAANYATAAQIAAAYQPLASVLTNTTAAFTTEQASKLAGIANGATANTGTVTSVAATVPTGLSVSGSPITTSGTLGFTLTAGYVIPQQSALDAKADESTTLTAGTGLTGGGDLSANRTLALDAASIASLALADSATQPADSVTTLHMATARLLGRTTASTGAVEEITVGSGLSLSAGELTATGGGSGTVTSVAISGTDGLEVDSGSPITTTGTITLGVNASTLRSHLDLEVGTDVLAYVAPGTSGNVLTSNGSAWTSAAPAVLAPTWGTLTGTTPALTFTDALQNRTLTLSGNTTFTAGSYAQGRIIHLFITGDSVLRTLDWPAWTWLEGDPEELAANKKMQVTLICTGSSAGDVFATYGVEL